MDSFKSVIFSSILLGIIVIALFNFVILTQDNNNVNDTLLNSNPELNKSFNSINANLSGIQSAAESQRESMEGENPIIGSDSLIFGTITGIKKFIGSSIAIFGLVFSSIKNVLGIPGIVISVISAMIIIATLLYFWRVIRGGE